MAIEVKIPPMGESITSGILAAWHVADGDTVAKEQVLYELETDKITSEGLAEESGVISLKAEVGAEVSIGQVVAVIEAGAAAKATETDEAGQSEPAPVQDSKVNKETTLSPAVRRVAAETGIDPSTVTGTGKGGRVTKGDLLEAAGQKPPEAAPAPAPAPKPSESAPAVAPAESKPTTKAETAPRTERTRMTPLRQRVAQRLVSAQREAALLTTFNEVDVSAVKDLRARYQESFSKKHGVKLGFMSFFIKAVVAALKAVPKLNARIDGDSIIHQHYYDIGVAVSTEKGLMVPVLRNCDEETLAGLERQLGDFARKAREGKIKIEDLEGGVFSITNGGVFGSLLSTPILNPPQSGILGMHTIQDRPVAREGQVVIRPMMYLALTYDHRLVDGSEAVTFLVHVKNIIEDPSRLLLDL